MISNLLSLNPQPRSPLVGRTSTPSGVGTLAFNKKPTVTGGTDLSKLTVGTASAPQGNAGSIMAAKLGPGANFTVPTLTAQPSADPSTSQGRDALRAYGAAQLGKTYAPTPTAVTPAPTGNLLSSQSSTQVAPTTPVTQPQVNTGIKGVVSYPGIVSSLVDKSSTPNDVYSDTSKKLVDTSTKNPLQSGGAYDVYGGAVKGLSDFRRSVADTRQNIYDAPTSARVMQGRDAAVQQANAQKEAALSSAVTQAQQALGYGIQEQQTQQSGLGTALGAANTQQGLQQSGLGTAAGYAAPQLGSIGQVPFNPLDQNQGTVLGTTQPGGVQAAGNLLGQFSGAQAAGAAPGQAQASNINAQQTAQVNALAQVYGQNAPQAYNLNTAINNIQSLGALTLQTLQGNNINPLTFPAGNQTIAQFKRQLGSAGQAAFDSNMANFQSALTAIYGETSGAIPTQVTKWGQDISSGNMPLKQLQAIYQQAINEGDIRLGNLKATVGSAFSGLQNSPTSGDSGGGAVVQTSAGPINTNW